MRYTLLFIILFMFNCIFYARAGQTNTGGNNFPASGPIPEQVKNSLPLDVLESDWFRIETVDSILKFDDKRLQSINENTWVLKLGSEKISATILFHFDPATGGLSWQSQLHAKEETVELTKIDPLCIKLPKPEHLGLTFRVIGGGSTHAQYPPQNYKEFQTAFSPGHDRGFSLNSGNGGDGRSSFNNLPLFQLGWKQEGGIVGGLEWSGCWELFIKSFHLINPIWTISIPIDGLPAKEWSYGSAPQQKHVLKLAKGESFKLPTAYLIFYKGDIDEGGNAMRRFLRQHGAKLDEQPPLPPLSYDSWFGLNTNINKEILYEQAEKAKKLGLEYFVIDAGWYEGCSSVGFMNAMGNWDKVDSVNFPQGLEPVVDMIKDLGLKPGLFFEISRSHRDSRWVKQNPELFLDVGSPYLYINFALPEAQKLVLNTVDRIVNRLDIKWLRWEMGFGPLADWDVVKNDGHYIYQYEEGMLAVLDSLTERHDDLLIELCSEGGHRIDLATLKRGHSCWFSDACENPLTQRAMQCGANRFLPGNYMNGAIPISRGTDKVELSDADIVSRMCGALSFGGCISRLGNATTSRAAELISKYKTFRHLLVENFYPLTNQPQTPYEGEAVMFINYTKTEAIVMVFDAEIKGNTYPENTVFEDNNNVSTEWHLKLKGLNGNSIYNVTNLLNSNNYPTMQGNELMDKGLQINTCQGVALLKLKTENPDRPDKISEKNGANASKFHFDVVSLF